MVFKSVYEVYYGFVQHVILYLEQHNPEGLFTLEV